MILRKNPQFWEVVQKNLTYLEFFAAPSFAIQIADNRYSPM